ncbi:hypothetical protein M426DRAFT_10191 [Hypoxylon sp. CI-4A]|nr:hypothetical protein M426DRAFT_10191 [Hypoxylon sp. CI-4A]
MDPATDESREVIENEIAVLEQQLQKVKARLAKSKAPASTTTENSIPSPIPSAQSAHHYLLLLSDSALPLGSFAFSSGLESYLAHTRRGGGAGAGVRTSTTSASSSSVSSFSSFLPLSVASYASTTLPFVLSAHANPSPAHVADLDDTLDAAVVCTVGRRASVAQGRALLSIWEKSMAAGLRGSLTAYAELLRSGSSSGRSGGGDGGGDEELPPPPVSAHFPPLFGAVASLCGLSMQQTAYVFLLGHVKALVSAAVRAGLFGPYQAQRILAGEQVQRCVAMAVRREWCTPVEEAGQCVPVMDFWVGRHELLYSRIFNS